MPDKDKALLAPFLLCLVDGTVVHVGWLMTVDWKTFPLLVARWATIWETKKNPLLWQQATTQHGNTIENMLQSVWGTLCLVTGVGHGECSPGQSFPWTSWLHVWESNFSAEPWGKRIQVSVSLRFSFSSEHVMPWRSKGVYYISTCIQSLNYGGLNLWPTSL